MWVQFIEGLSPKIWEGKKHPKFGAKLCHMIGNWLYFIIQVQKLGALCSPQNGGQKHPVIRLRSRKCVINSVFSVQFSVNFVPLQNLIANIPGMRQHNLKPERYSDTRLRAIPPAFDEEVR